MNISSFRAKVLLVNQASLHRGPRMESNERKTGMEEDEKEALRDQPRTSLPLGNFDPLSICIR